jgi:hypothetical protein
MWRRTLYSEIRLRLGGYCVLPAGNLPPLQPQSVLERVARDLARGDKLESSLQAAGYRATHSTIVSVRATSCAITRKRCCQTEACRELQDGSVTEVGIYIDSRQFWIVMAAPLVPGGAPAARFSAPVSQYSTPTTPRIGVSGLPGHRILELINQARATPRRCGNRFAAAPPVRWNDRSPYLRSALRRHGALQLLRPRQRPRRLAFMGSRRARRL